MHRTGAVVLVIALVGAVFAGGVVAADSGTGAETTASAELTCEFPLEIEDGGGETVTLEEEPEEVVVLAASNAQHMWEIGAQDKVTGMPVTPFTAYLEGSEDRTDVTDDQGFPVVEEVVALEPDLVIADDIIDDDTIEQLRDAGITVYHSPLMTSVEEMYDEVERVGQLVGECEGASQTVEETRQTMTEIQEAVAEEEPVAVYYDQGFPWTVGEGTLESQLISMAGGENIALETDEPGYFEINEEVIAENDPEWLIISEGAQVPDVTAIQESTAVEEDQVIEVNPNFISQHGPRNTIPLEQMAEAFHPETMAELEATPTPEETPTPTPDEPTPTPEETPTPAPDDHDAVDTEPDDIADADDDGAGFAAGAAIAALVALGVVGRSRR